MRLFLIRHGETVDNVAGVYAGITDSALTNHGVLQASRLGSHLATTKVTVAHIFSSDLQRAFRTAEAIREAQDNPPSKTTKLEILREQDFGFYEGKQFLERSKEGNKSRKDSHLEAHRHEPGFQDVESKESMKLRMETFVDGHLVQLLHEVEMEHAVVVVAHGIILSHLWRVLLKRFHPGNVSVLPSVQGADKGFSLEYLGGWSNTGYLELEVKPNQSKVPDSATDLNPPSSTDNAADAPEAVSLDPLHDQALPNTLSVDALQSSSKPVYVPQKPATPPAATSNAIESPRTLHNMSLLVMAVNNKAHLTGLKKTRGGIGNLKHDSKQKTMDYFLKKRRLE